MQINTKFDFGDEVKDTITGYKGIVVAITHYMTGCTHISMQAKMGKDGKVPEWESVDDQRLVLVKAAKKAKAEKPFLGGPAPKVEQW